MVSMDWLQLYFCACKPVGQNTFLFVFVLVVIFYLVYSINGIFVMRYVVICELAVGVKLV